MDVSIIITTYNHPRWLERVLWGYRFQTHQRLEIVVADDGSDEATRQTIEAMREKTGLTIRHIWHEDDGFRKCEILNKAILAATHPYLIFTDGDCVPRKDFLEQHIRLSEPNMFLSGGVVRLPQSVSKLISQETIQTGQALDWRWLRQKGLPWSRKAIRLTRNQGIARFLDGITTTRPTFNGHNVSVWKSDIIRVNGFNEEMKYGGLDREIGERMVHAGVQTKQVRHRAVCVHLHHQRSYATSQSWSHNNSIRTATAQNQRQWTEKGLDQHPQDAGYIREASHPLDQVYEAA